MTAKATAVLGPATAGKTTRLLARYRARLGPAAGIGRGLWIAPTHRAAEAIRGRLVAGGLGACLAPNCLTFSQFAEAVIQASLVPIRPLDRLEKSQLIRRLIDEAVRAKRLSYFLPIADTGGLADLVSELLSDLKRQEIWPDEFRGICERLGNAPKNCELADIYDRYQRLLQEHQLYDEEGRFWHARDLLEQGPAAPFAHVSLVVVDGFADFTRTQHEILALLGGRVDELWITLPWEAGRDELFHKSSNTLAELERRLPALERELFPRREPAGEAAFSSTMAHIEQQLFNDPRRIEPRRSAAGMEILAASGQLGEIELLARTIKRLLVADADGADAARVRPGDIAVVFRSTTEIAPVVREVFSEFGIPLAIENGVPLASSPLISALFAVLTLDIDDWPFRKLLELLSNNYFKPEWPEWRQGFAAADAEQAIRALQIPSGRNALLAALARLSNQELAEHAPARRHELKAAARTAHGVFTRLAAAFDRLPAAGVAGEWRAALCSFASELGMLTVACKPCNLPIARQDSAAWAILCENLQASMDLDIQLDGTPAKLDRQRILERIEQVCRAAELPREHDDVGRVRVLSAAGARAIDVPYLFVADLSEKAFPAAGREDRIYTASEHRRMNKVGLRFVEGRERACEEMLLFYEVITRATRRLWLSYSALDEAAQPLSPSPYLAEIERLFQPDAIRRSDAPNLSPVPKETEPFCARDLRVKAIATALDGSAHLAGQLLGRNSGQDATAALLHALATTSARSRGTGFGPFEGILLGAKAQAWLAAHFGPEHCWSTSQLEQYGHCPHQFFLKRVLELNEVADLSLEVNNFLRGRRLHAVLADLHRQLNALAQPSSPTACDKEMLARLVTETLAAVMTRSATEGAIESAFDCIDHQLIARWVGRYLEQYAKYDAAFQDFDRPPSPAHFEVSFGPVKDDEDAEGADPLSQPVPYELVCNGVPIRLSGRVDRIDIGLIEGQVVFNVLDYKTSASQYLRAQDIFDCKALQLPLYAMAVEDLLLRDQHAVPWHGGYWHVRDDGFSVKRGLSFHERSDAGLRRTEQWVELRKRLVERVARLVAGIQRGEFPMHCEDEHCTGRCAYNTVCRVHAVRSLEKTWQPPNTAE